MITLHVNQDVITLDVNHKTSQKNLNSYGSYLIFVEIKKKNSSYKWDNLRSITFLCCVNKVMISFVVKTF